LRTQVTPHFSSASCVYNTVISQIGVFEV
jgi:hypothetical protein